MSMLYLELLSVILGNSFVWYVVLYDIILQYVPHAAIHVRERLCLYSRQKRTDCIALFLLNEKLMLLYT